MNEAGTQPNKKRIRPWLIGLLTAFLLLAGAAAFFYMQSIEKVTFIGAAQYTPEQLEEMIFETPRERRFLVAFLNERLGRRKSIPFVERYSIEFRGIKEAEITLYEKSIVGCVEYMGSYMFFDKDGIIVESSPEKKENVPVISGLSFKRIVLHSRLVISHEETYEDILNLTQLLHKAGLSVDKIFFDPSYNVVFYLGDIKVRMGGLTSMEGKISELTAMLPQLEGLKGTLFLDTYNEAMPPDSYVFRKETDPEEPETPETGETTVETVTESAAPQETAAAP